MYKQDRAGILNQVESFSKIIRIFFILGFVLSGLLTIVVIIAMFVGSAVKLPIAIVGAMGIIILVIIACGLIVQIYFFRYYGKVINQTHNSIYTSPTPALIYFILSALSLLSSVNSVITGEFLPIFFVAINAFYLYLVLGVYVGLKKINDERYFDSQPTVFDYAPTVEGNGLNQATQTTREVDTATQGTLKRSATHDNGSWIKED